MQIYPGIMLGCSNMRKHSLVEVLTYYSQVSAVAIALAGGRSPILESDVDVGERFFGRKCVVLRTDLTYR